MYPTATFDEPFDPFTMEGEAMITLQDVIKQYRTGDVTYTALKGVSLEIRRGTFVAILGKSGSGKSTLLNMFTGIDRPTEGTVTVDNTDITHMGEGKLAKWRGRTIGIVFQFFQLLPTLSVLENVMLPMAFVNTIPSNQRSLVARQLLDRVGLNEHIHKFPGALSGGQQQRVAIARALANDPPIIVADEPTGNLDTATAEDIFVLFEELVEAGKTVVIVTHDDDLAARVPHRITITNGLVVPNHHDASHPDRVLVSH